MQNQWLAKAEKNRQKAGKYPEAPCPKCGNKMQPLRSLSGGVRYRCCGRIWERDHQSKTLVEEGLVIYGVKKVGP